MNDTVYRPEEIASAVAEFRRRFPAVPVWFGKHTGRWWALVDSRGWRLLEADSPGELGQAIASAAVGPRTRVVGR